MTASVLRRYSEEEYLALLEASDVPLEYVDGHVFRRPASSRTHGQIASNILRVLYDATQDSGIEVYANQMRLRVALPTLTHVANFFPDIFLSAEGGDHSTMFLTEPVLIVEIVSEETARTDLVAKAAAYRAIPSLQGYLLVDTATRAARLAARDGLHWREASAEGPGPLLLPVPGVMLPLDSVYQGTQVEGPDRSPRARYTGA